MFNYDPARQRAQLSSQGYAHLKGVLSDAFVAHLTQIFERALASHDSESDDWRITGKKRQFVFDFPSEADAEAFRIGMAGLTGIAPERFTISERHIKLYDDAAEPYPAPHKDRSASHFSIGLPIRLPQGSTVAVFPKLDPGPNPEERAVFLSPEPGQDMATLYAAPEADLLHEQVGDVVIFLGSALYHERMKSAGTAVLYIKVNGVGEDPLGENIYAAAPSPAATAAA